MVELHFSDKYTKARKCATHDKKKNKSEKKTHRILMHMHDIYS